MFANGVENHDPGVNQHHFVNSKWEVNLKEKLKVKKERKETKILKRIPSPN